jgi:hypothetical protein
MEIVLGPEMARHNTHIYGIRQLTRNIEFILPDLRGELVRLDEGAFDTENLLTLTARSFLYLSQNGWKLKFWTLCWT